MQEFPTLRRILPTRRELVVGDKLGHNYFFLEELPFSDLQKEPYRSHHRLIVFAEKGCECADCERVGTRLIVTKDRGGGIHIDVYTEDAVLMTVDHIYPRSMGGTEDLANKQPMCSSCNSKKTNTLPPEGQGVRSSDIAAKKKWKYYGAEMSRNLSLCQELPEKESLEIREVLFAKLSNIFPIGSRIRFIRIHNKNHIKSGGKVAALYKVPWSEENPWGLCFDIANGEAKRVYMGVTMHKHPHQPPTPGKKKKNNTSTKTP